MSNYFLGALKELERRSQDNVLIFSDVLSERLSDLCQSMIGNTVSDNDYMKLFELYYRKYHKQEKKKAMMYCILRIQQMASYKLNPKLRKNLQAIKYTGDFDEYTKLFLDKKRPYYANMQIDFKKKVAWASLILSIVFLSVCALGCNVSFFVSWFISILVFVLFNIFMVQFCFPYFYETQLESMQEQLDPLCKEFDLWIYNKE